MDHSNKNPPARLTRRERRELDRQQKRENPGQFEKQDRHNKLIRRSIGISIAAIVLAGIIWLVAFAPSRTERERPGEAFDIQGQAHISTGADHPAYNSNPPTSGWHYGAPVPWGVHDTELPDEQIIHNLEHGGIWISYKGIDDATKAALEAIARSQAKIVMEPRAQNDAPIVLVSWGRVQKFQTYDESEILAFIQANKNMAPEPFAQ